MAQLTRGMSVFDLFRVCLRLLFMQALLNRKGMQNLAIAGALTHVRGALAAAEGNTLLMRHLSYFNCNPNLVPLIIGAVMRLEEQKLEGKAVTEQDIDDFKRALANPLAAMGDLLVLGNLKPLALTFGCLFAIYKLPLGLLAVVLLYNLAIISCRFWGIYFGYAKGWDLVESFSGSRFQRALGVLQGVGAGVGGVLIGVIFDRFPQSGRGMLLLGSALVFVTVYLLKKDVPAAWLAIILFPVSVLVTLLIS